MFPLKEEDRSRKKGKPNEPSEEQLKILTKQIQELEAEIARLKPFEQEVTILRSKLQEINHSQVQKNKLHNFLQNILDVTPSDNVLVDITFDTQQNKNPIILGRPSIMGSSKRQMRHITPFSFVEQLIKSLTHSATSPEDLLKQLTKSLSIFLKHDKGLCLTEDLYNRLKISKDFFKIKITTENSNYYLINDQQIPKEWFTSSTLTSEEKQKAYDDYRFRKQDAITYAMDSLYESITDLNTYHIASEILARFMLTLFHHKSFISFPKEGHTLTYEIRLYDSYTSLMSKDSKTYFIVTSMEVNKKISNGEILDKRVRIVENEGAKIKTTLKALAKLNEIFNQSIYTQFPASELTLLQAIITEYNQNFNLPLYLANIPFTDFFEQDQTKKYNSELQLDTCYKQVINHIAKHLYLAFDFKQLENFVFVPSKKVKKQDGDEDLTGITQVFTSAQDEDESENFCITLGMTYRNLQRDNAKGYTKKTLFRLEATEIKLLTEKAIEHLEISIEAFLSPLLKSKEHPIEIIQAFANIISLDYEMNARASEKLLDSLKISEYFKHLESEIEQQRSLPKTLEIQTQASQQQLASTVREILGLDEMDI